MEKFEMAIHEASRHVSRAKAEELYELFGIQEAEGYLAEYFGEDSPHNPVVFDFRVGKEEEIKAVRAISRILGRAVIIDPRDEDWEILVSSDREVQRIFRQDHPKKEFLYKREEPDLIEVERFGDVTPRDCGSDVISLDEVPSLGIAEGEWDTPEAMARVKGLIEEILEGILGGNLSDEEGEKKWEEVELIAKRLYKPQHEELFRLRIRYDGDNTWSGHLVTREYFGGHAQEAEYPIVGYADGGKRRLDKLPYFVFYDYLL